VSTGRIAFKSAIQKRFPIRELPLSFDGQAHVGALLRRNHLNPVLDINGLDEHFVRIQVEVLVKQHHPEALKATVPLEHLAQIPEAGQIKVVQGLDVVDIQEGRYLRRPRSMSAFHVQIPTKSPSGETNSRLRA
jgi:hypothetical protein